MSNKYWSKTYNVVEGCSPASIGCQFCWAETMAKRFNLYWGTPSIKWKDLPRYRKPQTIFICNTSDLFHEGVDKYEVIKARVMGEIRDNPQHTFLMLTKRTKQMRNFIDEAFNPSDYKNLYLGATICNQQEADEKIPELLGCGEDWNYWLSIEPILGEIVLKDEWLKQIKSVVIGEENAGKKSRRCPHGFIYNLEQQLYKNNIQFFEKQTWEEDAKGKLKLIKHDYQNNLFGGKE